MSKEALPKHWTKSELFSEKQKLRDALQEIVTELDKSYRAECDHADWYNNNMPGVGQTIDYVSRPSMPIALKIATEALKP
jgi:hypothetical protein